MRRLKWSEKRGVGLKSRKRREIFVSRWGGFSACFRKGRKKNDRKAKRWTVKTEKWTGKEKR